MNPTRAAWFFAVGLAWLVFRGILVHALPLMQADQIAQHGGLLMMIPLISVAASLTAPLFFLSFLRRHRFAGQRTMRGATILALTASLLSAVLALLSFVVIFGSADAAEIPIVRSSSWLFQAIPLIFVGSILFFLVVFSRQSGCNARLRRSAGVAAVGTLVPTILIAVWIFQAQVEGVLLWYPAFSQSLVAKVLGLAAAGTLLWFLETFALSYDDGASVDRG